MRVPWSAVILLPLILTSCLSLSGTEPTPVTPPLTVSVTIEYVQPFYCANVVAANCSNGVGFSASWMQAGNGIQMVGDVTNHVWRVVAPNVPVNYPPQGSPYTVRVYDPYLQATLSRGYTAQNLTVGRQVIVDIASAGSPAEVGFIYIDANGAGHTPF
jgi:hypothetical protein